jgi:hypothetical protein
MKTGELFKLRKILNKSIFKIFFSNENKRLDLKKGLTPSKDLVLVSFPEGKQTATVDAIRVITKWTVVKSRAFVKEGVLPKVVIPNVPALSTETEFIYNEIAKAFENHGIVFKIY